MPAIILDDVQSRRLQNTLVYALGGGHGVVDVGEFLDEAARLGGHRLQFEIYDCDGRECSERADHDLGHVESGDVLNHHASALDDLAFERREVHPDDHVAGGSAEAPAWSADVGGYDAADSALVVEGWVERDHLPVFGERAGQLAIGQAGLDADGEVTRLVLKDTVYLPSGR